MTSDLDELRTRLAEHDDLKMAAAVLRWDQTTYMPSGGGAARGRQLATLERLAHERLTDPALARLLERARPDDAVTADVVRVARKDVERATRVPAAFVGKFVNLRAELYDRWTRARPADDFASVADLLAKNVEMSREYAGFFAPSDHVADPLIDVADPGMRDAALRPLFADLRAHLVPLVERITSAPPPDTRCLEQHFPEAAQIAFASEVAARFGYDAERGRLDKTHHPFMTKFSIGDVRITTRVREDDLGVSLFSILHEAGHALYEQNVDPRYEATPLAEGTSSGLHESQSRLWENFVGRSLPFWRGQYPRLQAAFPSQLGNVPLDTFYRAINRVRRGAIRTESDEVTYNLHIVMRFDFECELLEGKLRVRDLAEAWRARAKSDLGVTLDGDRNGCLQDVHWFDGPVGGAFQPYTLGNLMCAQFYAAAERAHPSLASEIEAGRFDTLRTWLSTNIHRFGRTRTADEIVLSSTGAPLSSKPFLDYLRDKYGKLYP